MLQLLCMLRAYSAAHCLHLGSLMRRHGLYNIGGDLFEFDVTPGAAQQTFRCLSPAQVKGLRIYPYPSGIGLGTRGTSGTSEANVAQACHIDCFTTVFDMQ